MPRSRPPKVTMTPLSATAPGRVAAPARENRADRDTPSDPATTPRPHTATAPILVARPPDERLERRWTKIAAKLDGAACWLQGHGGLVLTTLDGRPAWVVRYVRRGVGDRPKHASLFVCRGDCPELLDRVRRRLDLLRAEGRWVASLPKLARVAGRLRCALETQTEGQDEPSVD